MEIFEGRIELDGDVVAEKVIGVLRHRTDHIGRRSWCGSFHVSRDNNLSRQGTYRLVLEDGRSGEIVFPPVLRAEGEVEFEGSGPLA